MNSIQEGDGYDATPNLSPGSDGSGANGRFRPSARLLEKMEKLAKWRLDPSSIEIPQEGSELHGGHAMVSRAVLNPLSNNGGNEDGSDTRNNAGQKDVAVKKLKIPADRNLERLVVLTLREAGFLVELCHSNIVKLEGFVEDMSEGIIWLVFPWEVNGNLRDFIASRDWEIPERIWLINDVARGVEYLHGQNPPICHGDLKSVNVLVNSEFHALITDFGSARRQAEVDLAQETEQVGNARPLSTRLEATFCASTNTITLTGNEFTLRWAAPELLNDEPPTVKIDIWALGWIAYEVMTNAIPFEDVVKDSIVIKRVTQGHLPSITGDARMSLMLKLCCLMSECWSTDPSQRPAAIYCLKSLSWMPMISPNPKRTTSVMVPEGRSPGLLLQLGKMHLDQGDYTNASKFYTKALETYTDTSDREGRADTLMRLAEMHRRQGKVVEVIALYSEALEIFTSIGDRKQKAYALCGLAQARLPQREYGQAAMFYSEALTICTDIDDLPGKSNALFGLAEVHRYQNQYGEAIPLYSDALQIDTDLGYRRGKASNLWGLAEMHRLQNKDTQAIEFYSDALQIYTDIGDTRGKAFALLGLADVKRTQGYYNEAIKQYKQAAKIFEQAGDAGMMAYISARAPEAF